MKKTLAFSFLILFAGFAFGQIKRNIVVDDFLAIKDVSDPQISPDGRWVAYVVETLDAKKDKANKDIYMIPLNGGEPVRLTTFDGEDDHPRWSPDNKYLALLSKRNKKKQVFLLNRNGGDAIQLTNIKQGVSDFSWSPDSKKLALVISDPDPDKIDEEKEKKKKKKDEQTTPKPIVITRLQFKFDEYGYLKELYDHIYVFDLQSKSLKQITSGPYNDAGELWGGYSSTPQWSPDGKQILFVSNRTENPDSNRNTDLFVVPAEGGEIKKLTENPGTDESPLWSPDGKWIVYQQAVQPDLMWYDTTELAIIPATGGTPKPLTRELDRNTFSARFSEDGRLIYFILEDHGKQLLASVPAAGGAVNKNVVSENVIYDYDVASNGSIAFLAARPNLPYEVFTWVKGKTQQLTTTNARVLESIQLGAMDRIHFKSKDGTDVEGFVTRPPQFDPSKKYPLLLWIHGGPTAQYMEEFSFQAQLFAANGYVVLKVNPRGSTGYGENFCKAIWADWGNKDYDDVMAGVDYVISQGYVDENRLGVGGWSYGGILTDVVITKTGRFKAASPGASMLNHFLGYGIDHYQFEWEKEVGLPWEKPDVYLKLSPFFAIKNVTTPTLVICGAGDQNVPLVNSEQLYQTLRRLAVETMLVVYPDQPHSIYKPSYQKDLYERYLAWFGHYLQGAPSKIPEKK